MTHGGGGPALQTTISGARLNECLKAPSAAAFLYMLAAVLLLLIYLLKRPGAWNLISEEFAWYLFFIACVLLLIGGIVHAAGRQRVQSGRDCAAHMIEEKVRTGQFERAYFLYLRPFSSTGAIKLANPEKYKLPGPLMLVSWHIPWRLELERVVSDALAADGAPIGLGQPGEHFGAGRLPTAETEWRDTVRTLAKGARGIVVLPSPQQGTRWEIAWLKHSGLLRKAVFIMPPAASKRTTAKHRDRWREAALALEEHGLHLPDYKPHGLLFVLRPDAFHGGSAALNLASEEALRNAFLRLLESGACNSQTKRK